jgi:hypothetical protein
MSVLLCLLLAAGHLAAEASAPDVEIAPAPGAPVAAEIAVNGKTVALDAAGRGRVPSGASLSAAGLRLSEPDAGGTSEILYYPHTSALASWRLPGLGASGPASVVLKEHEAETWENARTFAAPLEKTAEGRRVRFAIPAGLWDAAIVVPGFAPAFVLELDVYEDDEVLRVAATKLEPAALLGARVLDARTGRSPHHWKAWISPVDGPRGDEETRFFEDRPIAEDGSALDFASLPVGEWELRVEALESGSARGRARAAVKAARPRERVNLGDIYLADFGSLRVAVTFPTRVPDREFACWVTRVPLGGEGQLEGLGSKDFTPSAANDLVFDDLEAGPVTIQCGDHKDIYDRREATIVAGEVAAADFSFAPVRVSGSVRRGDDGVSGANVAAVLSGPDELKVQAKSDERGSYDLVVWPARNSILLLTTPPEDRLPFAESLDVGEGQTEIEHDVQLPSRSIRGTVRDQETGAILPGADVTFSGPLEAKGLEEGRFSMSTMSDGEGRFRLGNLLDQPLDVEVTLAGYAPSVRTGIQPTPEGAEIEVLLEKGSRLTGVVVDELGAPVSNVAVGLDVDSGGDYVQRTRTSSASGEFDFGAVASGPHLLTAFRCGSVFAFERFDVASYETDPPPRVVRLRPAAAPIELQVVDENDEPVAETGFRWSVGGLPVPMEDWAAAAQACGQASRTNGSGMLRLYGFPPGVIGAASVDRVPLGTFPNDGTRRQWTLRLQREEEHPETVPGSVSR